MGAEATELATGFDGQDFVDALTAGSNRSSRFTQTQADQFIEDGWTVVQHKSNTTTGFGGTLFKDTGPTDTARGLTNGEPVLSFRSTEFADDSARDNQAANSIEISEKGWAFRQIADMEVWCATMRADPIAANWQ